MITDGPKEKLFERVSALLGKRSYDKEALRLACRDLTLAERLTEVFSVRPIPVEDIEIDEIAEYIEAYRRLPQDGKNVLLDGRSGEAYDCRVTVGQIVHVEAGSLGGRQNPRSFDRTILLDYATASGW